MNFKLIIIRGPLGVGKTTISKLLAEKLKAEYLSLDKITDNSSVEGKDGIPVENFMKSNKIIIELVKNSNKPFILDGCFYYQEQIDELKKEFGDKLAIFSLMSDVEKCIQRDSKRNIVYGEDAARYVHMITSKIKAGYEIDNNNLSPEEVVTKILQTIKK